MTILSADLAQAADRERLTDHVGTALPALDILIKAGSTEVRPGQTRSLYAMSRIAPDVVFSLLNRATDKGPSD